LWSRPEGGKARPTHGAWRDPIVQWIDARQRGRKEAHEKKVLEELERKKLQAEGVSAAQAKEHAAQVAAVMVCAAAGIKQRTAVDLGQTVEVPTAIAAPVSAKQLIESAEKPRALTEEEKKRLTEGEPPGVGARLLGGRVRFLLGALLLVLCFLWM